MSHPGSANGFSRLYNTQGITHIANPFMFRLTLCGLHLDRDPRPRHDRRRAEYQPCKRCHR